MKLNEAIELLRLLSEIPVKESVKHPELRIFHNMTKGYTVHIKAQKFDTEYHKHLEEIVESLNLEIREEKGALVIFRQSSLF